MPKLGRAYDGHLSFDVPDTLREELVALAYLEGDPGNYGRVARKILRQAVNEYVAQLDPAERKDYDKILNSVRDKTLVSRMAREGRVNPRYP